MTPLARHLTRRIASAGPITVAEYMTECLLHPQHGYYRVRQPFGETGDFTTAPEISQMFGELLGLGLARAWLDQGAPDRFTLAELGPGRGTCMADILRATQTVPGFAEAAQVHLVEASQVLRDKQRATLGNFVVTWHDTVHDLPDAPLFLVANEFFDALPIRQFIRAAHGWRERLVGMKDGQLAFGTGDAAEVMQLSHRLVDTKPGDMVEISEMVAPVTSAIAHRIAAYGGAALIIDYGDWHSQGDTLQALQDHKPVDPLSSPGHADLTAHVDFAAIAAAAHGIQHSRLTPQGVFLERLGITPRAQALAEKLGADSLKSHVAAHRRLTHPQEMGSLFKVLGLAPAGSAPLPGLDP